MTAPTPASAGGRHTGRRAALILVVAVVMTCTGVAMPTWPGGSSWPGGSDGSGWSGGLGAGRAVAAPNDTVVPCGDVLWGACDTRATAQGYQYRYHDGKLERISDATDAGAGTGRWAAHCGEFCQDDPTVICEMLEVLGKNTQMSPEVRAQWEQQSAGCLNFNYLIPATNAVPLAAVQAALNDYLREKILPKPTIVISPSGRSFAGLATILHTPVPNTYTFNVEEPVVATISAVPHYRWEFGDGDIGPDAPGRPYDSAISPREHPDAYVSHTYDHAGDHQVTLTVTWQGTFTVPGVAQAFPLDAVVLAAVQPLVVNEASGVLVHND